MTGMDWIVVAAMLVGGIALGLLASRLVFRTLAKDTRPEALQGAAPPLSSLVLWAGVIAGLIGALGVISPESLEQMPKDLIAFLPRVLSAAIIVILANVVSSFALTAIGPALARASASVQRQVAMAVKGTIVGLAVLLAVAQLGIDTTVINLGVAAIFFGLSASFTLLVGLGGRAMAGEVAATRILRRTVNVGDRIETGALAGRIVGVHPTAIELETETGQRVLVPSSTIAGEQLVIDRAARSE